MSFHRPLRHTTTLTSTLKQQCPQTRHASLLRRPKRPYTFTQLLTLSDGSTYTHRTTSPLAVYRSSKDTRNTLLWNPSSQKLMNVEEDEAGRLRAFRRKFGRGWDAAAPVTVGGGSGQGGNEGRMGEEGEGEGEGEDGEAEAEEEESLLDLISGFGQGEGQGQGAKGVREGKERSGKGKGGER